MKKILWLLLFSFPAFAAVYNVNSAQNQATIQGVLNGAAPGDTVNWAAGTYNVSSTYNLPCGVTYTGPVANPSTAVLNATYTTTTVIGGVTYVANGGTGTFALAAGSCTQMTTVEYFKFQNGGGIKVTTPFSNLTITHNQHANIRCCQNNNTEAPGTSALFVTSPSGSNANYLTNLVYTWNTAGDGTSCTSPTNAMTSYASPETIQGACVGLVFFSSVNGAVIQNNVIGPVGEGIHFQCSGGCEPPNGYITKNVDAEFNDFFGVHRISWEEQPQVTQNVIFENNSEHDSTNPYFGNFALSLACCDTGATAPGITVSNNVLIQNPAPHVRWGYGIEAWGNNAVYSNNLIQNGAPVSVGHENPQGISWCYGMLGGKITNNTVQGPNYKSGNATVGPCNGDGGGNSGGTNFIGNEGICNNVAGQRCGLAIPWSPGTVTGNVTGTTISTVTSAAPSISPAAGAQTFPLTVTATDLGLTSGSNPLGNTSIWYTTDGSTPVPGSGTAQQLSTGGSFVLPSAGTVKAVGMWGTGANPPTHPSGYGFVPSGVVSVTYTGGGTPTAATPVLTPGSQSFSGTLSVSVSDSTPSPTIYCTTNGTTPTTGSPVYSGAFSLTTTTTIQCIATASGYLQSAVGSGTYSASAPTLTGGFQGNSGSINHLAVGAPAVAQQAIGTYSDGLNRNLPDAFGNTAVWSSSNGAILNVDASGNISCLTTGTASSKVTSSPTGKVFNPWTWTCTAALPNAPTGIEVIVVSENRENR